MPGPGGLSGFAKEEPIAVKYQTMSTVASHPHLKPVQTMPNIPEVERGSPKRRQEVAVIQKKVSGREIYSPKAEMMPRMSANTLASPKGTPTREKVLVSYGSEKNLNSFKPFDKKETTRNAKLE